MVRQAGPRLVAAAEFQIVHDGGRENRRVLSTAKVYAILLDAFVRERVGSERLNRAAHRHRKHGTECQDDRRGLGLGLYIARRILEAHGGTIEVDSALGAGAAFTFTLPTTAGEGRAADA